MLEYAASLAGGPTTWHLALEYLAWCPRYGESATAAVLERVAETAGPRTAAKLVRMSDARDMAAVAATVCHLQGAAALRVSHSLLNFYSVRVLRLPLCQSDGGEES